MGDGDTLLVSRHEQLLRPLLPLCGSAGPRPQSRSSTSACSTGQPSRRASRSRGTWFPESAEEVQALSTELSFPCLLKPYTSHIGRRAIGQKVLVARSADELNSGYERLAARDVPAMVQEIVPGEDRALFGYLAFWDSDGRELAWVTKRKLRQGPPGFGDGSLQVTVEAPEVADMSRRLLRAVDYRGFGCVEFKQDSGNGNLLPDGDQPEDRVGQPADDQRGGGSPLDRLPVPDRLGRWRRAHTAFRPGIKFLNEELDIKAVPRAPQVRRHDLGQWARSVRGTTSTAIWARDDPLPFVVLTWRLAASSGRQVRGRPPARDSQVDHSLLEASEDASGAARRRA